MLVPNLMYFKGPLLLRAALKTHREFPISHTQSTTIITRRKYVQYVLHYVSAENQRKAEQKSEPGDFVTGPK